MRMILCSSLLLCKFSIQSPSDMSDSFVKHIRGTRFDSIKYETCVILCGILPLLLPTVRGIGSTVAGTRLTVACTRPVVACTWPMVAGTDLKFTEFIDLVQLSWIHMQSANYCRQNRALGNFTSYWHKCHRQLVLKDEYYIIIINTIKDEWLKLSKLTMS
jgi:hypothetical protein